MSAVPLVDSRTFTLGALLSGARRSVPLAVSDAAYGVVFGVLARQAGLSLPEAVLMSGLIYSGSAQFIALGLWTSPLPVLSLVAGTLVVNLGYLLMGATLRPWLAPLSPLGRYATVFLLSDENWALSLPEIEARQGDGAFLLGSGLVLYASWMTGTMAGRVAGAFVLNPAGWGLDFAFTALFAALLVGRYRQETPYMFWMYPILISGSLLTAAVLVHRDSRLAWLEAGVLPGRAPGPSRSDGSSRTSSSGGRWPKTSVR